MINGNEINKLKLYVDIGSLCQHRDNKVVSQKEISKIKNKIKIHLCTEFKNS